jgi:hypothetical protein
MNYSSPQHSKGNRASGGVPGELSEINENDEPIERNTSLKLNSALNESLTQSVNSHAWISDEQFSRSSSAFMEEVIYEITSNEASHQSDDEESSCETRTAAVRSAYQISDDAELVEEVKAHVEVKAGRAILDEVEQVTIEQAAQILGLSQSKVRGLINNQTLCCVDSKEAEPRLSAACVRAQAGKSKAEFMQAVKRLIAGENTKRRKNPSSLPKGADSCLEELFENTDASSVSLSETSSVPMLAQATKTTAVTTASTLTVVGIDRFEITNKNLHSVLENLDFTSVRLEGSMHRIGYLEAKLEDLQKELSILPELRSKWAKSLILERENEEYKETIAKRERELLELHQFVDKIKQSFWCRFWCWLTGTSIN